MASRFVEETAAREDWPLTFKVEPWMFETVMLPEEETFASVALPEASMRVTPAVRSAVVAFTMSAERVPERVRFAVFKVVTASVAMVPEGERSSVEDTTPETSTLPDPATRNRVDEFTWNSMKLPLKGVRFAARKVPETDPCSRRLGPR